MTHPPATWWCALSDRSNRRTLDLVIRYLVTLNLLAWGPLASLLAAAFQLDRLLSRRYGSVG